MSAGVLALGSSPASAAELLPNASVELGTATPTGWTSRIFGSNTSTFTWANEGRTGTRSLRIDTTARTSGDAKWYFAPVAVTPSTTYTYSAWIRSTIGGQFVAEYRTAAGVVTTQWLADLPASPGVWTQRSRTFTTPATTTSMSIYHLIAGIGTIEIDDGSLPEPVVVPLTATVTSPLANATVAGATVGLAATTTGTGILGVQFKVDGTNVGAEDTAAPYATTWDSTTVADGPHAVTAVVRTAAATATSAPVSISTLNAPPTQLVANPSAELGATTPTGWTSRTFGTNTSSFTWSTNGRTGNRSLRVDTTARVSGDAKWYFTPVAVTPGTTYTYSAWIRSTIGGQFVAEYRTPAGTVTTQWLADLPASPGVWTQRSRTFTTPATATSMSIYHLIAGIGTLEIDDVSLPPAVAPPLTATVTAPLAGATVAGDVTLTATTTGNAVLGVQFFVDGVKVGAEDTTAPYTVQWDSSPWVNGPRTVTAQARTVLAAAPSAPIAVTLANAPPPELLTNSAFELSDGTTPIGWTSDSFGNNTATFSYPVTGGHDGGRYAGLVIDTWVSGDAKWLPSTPTPVVAGKSYRFSDWYRSSNQSEALVEVALANGSFSYLWIGSADPAATWTAFSGVIKMPATAVSATVWHALIGPGFLDVDELSFKLEPFTRFVQPLVTLTFDDGRESDITHALPKLQQYGLNGTFYLVPNYLSGAGYLTPPQVLQLRAAGMEIGAHTMNHADLATLTPAQQAAELTGSRTALETLIGAPVPNFASPFGSYNASALALITSTFGSHRTTLDGHNTRTATDRYQLFRQTISPSTTPAQVTAWLDQAKADGSWLILVYHDISPTPGSSGTTPATFDLMMQAVKNSGVTTKTMADALAEVLPQLPA